MEVPDDFFFEHLLDEKDGDELAPHNFPSSFATPVLAYANKSFYH